METEIFKGSLERAAELIKNGGLVAVPTETVYGLACSGLDEDAVSRIYEVKGRPAVKPLALMVPGADDMDRYCLDVPKQAKALAKRFWPGPLTIVLKAKDIVPDIVRAGGATVGLRCPDHPMTLEALRLAGLPFAAPSANPSGEESPKNAEAVYGYFNGKIAGIIDGGKCGIGTESTLIDMSDTPYKILRQGALPAETIAEALVENMTLVGITGGTGCGKTTALQELRKLGALIIDCDSVYHELIERGGDMIQEIDESFEGVIINGVLDRKALGAVVFSDEAALAKLNAITHKHIGLEVSRLLRNWAMQGGTMAAIDAIELISSGLAERCAFTVGIIAQTETRAARIMARDNISREYALLRIKAQRPNSYFEENCTFVLSNDGNKEEFAEKFNRLIKEEMKNG